MRDKKFLYELDEFTVSVLDSADQNKFADSLWVLRNSWAAREIFANYQLWCHGDSEFECALTYIECLDMIAVEVTNRLDYEGWTPSRGEFMDLKEALEVPTKPNRWHDETLYRTILGWRQL